MTSPEFSGIPPSWDRDDVNAIVDHAFEKPCSFIIRKHGTNYEAIYGSAVDQAGKIAYRGTDASTVIQAAIDALNTGGKILIKKAIYPIKSELLVPNALKSVLIEGEMFGWLGETQGSILWATSPMGADDYILKAEANGTGISRIGFYGAGLCNGVLLGVWDCWLRESMVTYCKKGVLAVAHVWIDGNWIEDNNVCGVWVAYSGHAYVWIKNNIFYNRYSLYDILIEQWGAETNEGMIWIKDNTFIESPRSVNAKGIITALIARDNFHRNVSEQPYHIEGTIRNLKIVGDILEGENTTKNFMLVESSGVVDWGIIRDVTIRNITASPFSLLGSASLKYKNVRGYITENKGIVTIVNGTTSIVVTHNCDYTPSAGDIDVHPIETLASASFWWIDTITSTQFTIHVNINPTQDVDFKWSVRRI